MSNFLLLNPPAKTINEKMYDLPDYLHISLLYLSASLEKNNIDFEVIDCKLSKIDYDSLLHKIKNDNFKIIGFTSFTHEIKYVHQLASEIKKNNPLTKIIIGGAHCNAVGAQILEEFCNFDFGLTGECENTLPLLIKTLINEENPKNIEGLIFRNNDNKIIHNQNPERIDNLDELPAPAYHLFPQSKKYYLLTSRGCPFKCVFCSRQHGNIPRFHSVERVVNEFENIVRNFKPEYVIFADENFTVNRGRCFSILEKFIERGLNHKVEWEIQTHINLTDKQLLKKLFNAGCRHICFGIESGNTDILNKLKKSSDLNKAAQIVETANKLGFRTELNCIIGHPFETVKTALDTINFVSKLNPYLPVFGIMIPYPDTEVYKMAKNNQGGYILKSENWNDYNKQLGNALELKTLSIKKMKFLQLYGYIKIYIANFRFIDFIKFCFKYRCEALAFLKNLFFQKKP